MRYLLLRQRARRRRDVSLRLYIRRVLRERGKTVGQALGRITQRLQLIKFMNELIQKIIDCIEGERENEREGARAIERESRDIPEGSDLP